MTQAMLPDEGRFPLLVHDRRFAVLYQRGELNPFRSRWTRSDTGNEYLVVCPCGRGTHARYLDDAVAALRSSYILRDDGSHEHDDSAFPCNIVEATQDGEHGFIVGKIVVPELVDYFKFHPESEKKISLPTKEVAMESLIRWQPFRELTSMQDRMNRLFDEFFGRRGPLVTETEESWGFGPPVDIYEDAHKLTFKVEIPGMEEKDLKVEVEDNTLTVSGERKMEKEVKEEHFRRKERHYGAFSRSFTLPASVDTEKIEANYVNGVLAIELPKRAELKPKQIKVNVARTLKAA